MPKTVLADQSAWARILYAVNPDGAVPGAGPATTVAAFVERALAPYRAMDPVRVEARELMSAERFALLGSWVDDLEARAEPVPGRAVVNLTPPQRQALREDGVPERLERVAGQQFAGSFEALVMYYATEGFLPLHVDDQAEYQFNALINVRRVRPAGGSGTGTLFWLERGPVVIDLEPGEAVLFDAHHTPHGRLPLTVQDQVVLLSLGFTAR